MEDLLQKIKEAVRYEPETGLFYWRLDRPDHHFGRSNDIKKYLKKQAGQQIKTCLNSGGYIHFRFQYKVLSAHRVAVVLMLGHFPNDDVDHINGNRSDNRWENLREVPRVLNCRNRQKQSNNLSGYTGVSYRAGRKAPWTAKVRIESVETQLGAFQTAEEAYAVRTAYLSAHPELGYTSAHGHR